MSFQVIVSYNDQSWDSIRDTDRQALHKVAEYMKQDSESHVVAVGNLIQEKLIFGHSMETIRDILNDQKFVLIVKYIP